MIRETVDKERPVSSLTRAGVAGTFAWATLSRIETTR